MLVYHGSYTKIDSIDLSKCRPNLDFGQGFYVTKIRRHAEEWAIRRGKRAKTKGFVTEFHFVEGLFAEKICKIKRFEGYTEEWLDFVVMNRNQELAATAHDYDIVEGPVANDDIVNRMNDYLNNKISKTDFLHELTWHEETHQICFCTVASLQTLRFADNSENEFLLEITHIGRPIIEALMLDRNIDERLATDLFYGSKTFTHLADNRTGLYKKTWQEIYEMFKKELM